MASLDALSDNFERALLHVNRVEAEAILEQHFLSEESFEELERIVQLAGQYGRTDEASMMVLAGYREAYKTPLEAPHTPEVVRNWKLDMNHSVCSSDSGADSPW